MGIGEVFRRPSATQSSLVSHIHGLKPTAILTASLSYGAFSCKPEPLPEIYQRRILFARLSVLSLQWRM